MTLGEYMFYQYGFNEAQAEKPGKTFQENDWIQEPKECFNEAQAEKPGKT